MREKVLVLATKNERHYTATCFLAAFSIIMIGITITMIGIIITRQWELDTCKAHGLQLSGVEQLDKLTQCQNKVMELVEMRGQCSTYKELTGNNSVVVANKDEIKGLLKDQVSKEAEYHEDCKKNLKSVQSELRQTEKNITALLVEKERLKGNYKTCSDELEKCNGELAKCSQNLKQ